MSLNTDLATEVVSMVEEFGFGVVLEQAAAEVTGDFDPDTPSWDAIATVKGVWDAPRFGRKGVNDGAPESSFQRPLTIAYREGLKDTSIATKLRVRVDGVYYNVLSVAMIGDKVGNRLYLDAGA